MAEERVISSISEYVQAVCQLNDALPGYEHISLDTLLFRGQSNKEYELIPAIGRNRNTIVSCSIFNDERNLIEMAKYKMPDVFRNEMSPIELLALLQHHGIPTRLLDITENALVALYFACCGKREKEADGEVIVFKYRKDDVTNYPIANAIADSYRFASRDTWLPLSRFYRNVKSQPYFLEQKHALEAVYKTDEAGGEWIAECCEEIRYIYAPVRSLRQQVQQGRYILFPNQIIRKENEESAFVWMIEAIPKDHEDIAARIIIPKEIKEQLLSDLSVMGIREEFLFCDSVDTVCRQITESYRQLYE